MPKFGELRLIPWKKYKFRPSIGESSLPKFGVVHCFLEMLLLLVSQYFHEKHAWDLYSERENKYVYFMRTAWR